MDGPGRTSQTVLVVLVSGRGVSMMSNRIKQSLLVTCVCLAAGRGVAAETKPNFVFMLTDDQRWDALGVVQREQGDKGRFPWLKTPNLDKLAAEGVRFRNAFVVNSLCAPSRASFLTGTYGHHNGIRNNGTPFPADSITYASVLRSAGYTTGYVGKWHMDQQRGQRPGFDYSASFIGQGRYRDCPFEVNGKQTETTGWVDDVSTDYAIQFLNENRGKPFVLALGFKTCHGPFSPPPRRASDYEGAKARPVPNLGSAAPYRKETGPEGRVGASFAGDGSPKLLDYMRCITAMDENVGRVMAELDRLGAADNTVVVFAGDNGYYLREHGLGDKRTAYEESLRIPLLVRWPGRAAKGKLVDQMVLNIDLAPTILELAGVPVPAQMQGRSWRPLLEGKTVPWRRSFYYEYFFEAPFASPHVQAVRTERGKLIRYPGHPEWSELFDLAADPYETKNLINDPAKADLHRELEAEFQRERQKVEGGDPTTSRPAASTR
ncbi:MAG: sulfatase [Planctomycetes bacterium]|nr:sulfatase [Planctomycetota bacterium]